MPFSWRQRDDGKRCFEILVQMQLCTRRRFEYEWGDAYPLRVDPVRFCEAVGIMGPARNCVIFAKAQLHEADLDDPLFSRRNLNVDSIAWEADGGRFRI
jgi:hypothetical protein